MKPYDLILNHLNGVKTVKALTGERHAIACCPAHEDKHPSCDLRELPDGRLLITCRAGCGAREIVEAVGLSLADLYPPNLRIAPAGRKGRGSSAAPQSRPGVSREELADAAYTVFSCAQAVLRGEKLSDKARLDIAQIVGRLDPLAISRAVTTN